MSLVAAFASHLAGLGLEPAPALVAVSGGPDSVALLDLLVQTADAHGMQLTIAHADHGIHAESGAVVREVEGLARWYGLPCVVGRLELGPKAGETAARLARRAWLEQTRESRGARHILTAHHADDQAETVLMRVLRGSGPAGLSAIASRQGPWVRPLLPFRRESLARYLRTRDLPSWDDPANRDPRHLRSWIRGTLLPAARERLPDLDARLIRVARQAAFDRAAWDEVLERLPGLDWRDEPEGGSVDAAGLGAYEWPLGGQLLMAMARRLGCVLGPERAARALRSLRGAGSGTTLELGRGWRLEVVFDRLHLAAPPTAGPPTALAIEGPSGRGRWGGWTVRWGPDRAPPVQLRDDLSAWFIPQAMAVRSWRAGERLRPLGGSGRRLIARCFQDARIPRSRRGNWPVLEASGEAVWIPGVCRSDALVPPPGSEAMRVDATRS